MSEPLDWTAVRDEPLGSRPAPVGDQAIAYPPPVGTPNPRAPKKRTGLIVGLVAAAVVVLLGLGLGGYALIGHKSLPGISNTFTVHGSLTITNSASCTSIFTDIEAGAQVVITDEKNTTLGVGQLASENACRYTFTVPKVPTGRSFYGVTIGRHGTVQFTEAQLRQGADLTLD